MKLFKFIRKFFIVEAEILKRKCVKDNTFDALSEINVRMMNAMPCPLEKGWHGVPGFGTSALALRERHFKH